MPICLARVDDRLIHGQVALQWQRHLQCDAIIIVDDQVASDPLLQDVLTLAAPPNTPVRIYCVDEACRKLTQQDIPQRILLLMRSPEVAQRLHEAGVPLPALNIGGLAYAEGRQRVFQSIALAPEHVEALDALAEQGVEIYFQLIPNTKRASWQEVRARLKQTIQQEA